MLMRLVILLIVFCSIMLQACFKIEPYSPIPSIEFLDFRNIDTTDLLGNKVMNGTLHFYFVDGDGDIGFDTISPRQNTIFLEKFKVVDGVETKIDMLIPLNYFVPKFDNSTTNKTLKGEMIIDDLNENYPLDYDTIIYKFYIVDRAGNSSNIESTGYVKLR